MKAIALTAFNRPLLLDQTLKAILNCNPDGWTVFVSLEHGASKECEEIVAFYGREMSVVARGNGWQLGCDLNNFVVCRSAIKAGAEAVLFMEEDILLSPDALALCDWYLNQPRKPNDMGISLCRRFKNDPSRPNSISATETDMGHFGQGWCFTRQMWQDWILRYWWSHDFGQPDSFDWALCLEAQKQGKVVLRPRLARSKHAGTVGFHGPGIGVFPEVISDGRFRDYKIE